MRARRSRLVLVGALSLLVGRAGAGALMPADIDRRVDAGDVHTSSAEPGDDIIDTRTRTALSREWVEIREESEEGRIVLRPLGPDIPPARGRRRLDLSRHGEAASRSPGAADAMETRDGSWKLPEEGVLEIVSPGWTGTYTVIELLDDKLVIEPR